MKPWRGLDCLRLFAEQLQDVPKENTRIVGTATLRLAGNVGVFLVEAERILGHHIEVITGEDEARTIYQGVSWTSSGEGKRLVIDIGGASTELVIGEQSDAKLLNSLHMGCITWLRTLLCRWLAECRQFCCRDRRRQSGAGSSRAELSRYGLDHLCRRLRDRASAARDHDRSRA